MDHSRRKICYLAQTNTEGCSSKQVPIWNLEDKCLITCSVLDGRQLTRGQTFISTQAAKDAHRYMESTFYSA